MKSTDERIVELLGELAELVPNYVIIGGNPSEGVVAMRGDSDICEESITFAVAQNESIRSVVSEGYINFIKDKLGDMEVERITKGYHQFQIQNNLKKDQNMN